MPFTRDRIRIQRQTVFTRDIKSVPEPQSLIRALSIRVKPLIQSIPAKCHATRPYVDATQYYLSESRCTPANLVCFDLHPAQYPLCKASFILVSLPISEEVRKKQSPAGAIGPAVSDEKQTSC